MSDYTRNFQFEFPESTDPVDTSLVSPGGVELLKAWIDGVDLNLHSKADVGGTDSDLALRVWETSGSDQVFTSTATIANVTLGVTAKITIGNPTSFFTVGTVSGDINFVTSGFYRLTIAPTFYYSTGWTEGQCSFGLKLTGTAAYVTRVSKTIPIDTYGGTMMPNASFIIRAASSGGDVDLTSTYKIGFQQTNSSGGSVNYGDSAPTASWFALEYIRPLT